jgi:hypothetical protein
VQIGIESSFPKPEWFQFIVLSSSHWVGVGWGPEADMGYDGLWLCVPVWPVAQWGLASSN